MLWTSLCFSDTRQCFTKSSVCTRLSPSGDLTLSPVTWLCAAKAFIRGFLGFKAWRRISNNWGQYRDVQLPIMQPRKQTKACNKIPVTRVLNELDNLRNVFMHYCAVHTWKQDRDLIQWTAGPDCLWRAQLRPMKVSYSLRWLIPVYVMRSRHDRVVQFTAMHQLVSTCVKNSSVHAQGAFKEWGGPGWRRLHRKLEWFSAEKEGERKYLFS